jgi:hypothetical protein
MHGRAQSTEHHGAADDAGEYGPVRHHFILPDALKVAARWLEMFVAGHGEQVLRLRRKFA